MSVQVERGEVGQELLERREAFASGPGRQAETGGLRPGARLPRWGLAAVAGLVAFFVYWRTLGVSIAWGDSPELTAAAYQAGVPHPTGYPLYMILSHVFLRLFPLGSVAYKMNLLSALFAAVAVALVYRLMLQVSRSRIAALMTSLAFAFTPTFWSQAVIAEVYAFHMLGLAGVLVLVLAWEARGDRRWLWGAALAYGFCFTHHLLSVLLAPGLLFFALTSRHRRQFLSELRWTLPLFLLPLLVYLYLPWAALRDPDMNWGDPRNWENFVAHVTGRQYRPAMFHLKWPQILQRLKEYSGLGVQSHPGFLPAQFGVGFLWLALPGLWSLARRRGRLFILTLSIYLLTVVYSVNYYIYDVEVYYLPAHLMVALWIAGGLRQLGVWLARLWRRIELAPAKRRMLNPVLGAALGIMPLSLLWGNWSLNDRSDDWSALTYARAALDGLKPNAIILSGDDNFYFPLMYARFVENRRPDVTLMSFYDLLRPERSRLATRHQEKGIVVRVPPDLRRVGMGEDNRLLKNVIADNVGRRPVYLLAQPESLRYEWLVPAINPFYRVVDSNIPSMELLRRGPAIAVTEPQPQQPKRVRFGPRRPDGSVENGLELLGYDLEPRRENGIPWVRLTYYWRVHNQAMARPAKVWVLFTDAEGNYRRKADGSPDFHNIHPLGYGMGLGTKPLPPVLRESFEIYIPPQEWNKRLHIRLAVALGETFLQNGKSRDPWVRLGELPTAAPGAAGVKVAASRAQRLPK